MIDIATGRYVVGGSIPLTDDTQDYRYMSDSNKSSAYSVGLAS